MRGRKRMYKENGTRNCFSSLCPGRDVATLPFFFFSAGCTHSYCSWHWWCHKENCRWFLAALEGEGIGLWTCDARSLSLQPRVSPGRRRWSCVGPFLPAQGEKLGISKERWLHGEGGWGSKVFFKWKLLLQEPLSPLSSPLSLLSPASPLPI